jgi:hypothetical protein
MLRNMQVRTFMNLLPSSEGDTDKYVADQPLEVRLSVHGLANPLNVSLVFSNGSL